MAYWIIVGWLAVGEGLKGVRIAPVLGPYLMFT